MSHLCEFGSEYHLLRYLGRHRGYLNARVLETVAADSIGWIDFHFDRLVHSRDDEIRGLEFVEDPEILADWGRAWPHGSQSLEWDSVAQIYRGDSPGFLLLDACSNFGDLESSCQASNGNREQIAATLAQTARTLGVSADCDWMERCYGLASRLAALSFLDAHGIEAHLLRVYFVGDEHPRHECPESPEEWKPALDEQAQQIGLPAGHALSGRLHELFLPVCPLSRDDDE